MKTKTCSIVLFLTFSLLWPQKIDENNKTLRILTFNILHGATTKGDFNLDIIAKVIKDVDPDFVALQEVDFKTDRIKGKDLLTELAGKLNMIVIFARAMYFSNGEYGNAILSKYTFLKTRNVLLPQIIGSEPRCAIEVVPVLSSEDTIAFISTHLDHSKGETDRIEQAKMLNEIFTTNKYPTILAGDLNAIPGSNPINILEEVWNSSYNKENPEPTYPSNNPQVKIDYVMTHSNDKWKVIETKVIQDSVASDHCAYFVILELIEK